MMEYLKALWNKPKEKVDDRLFYGSLMFLGFMTGLWIVELIQV